MEGIRDQLDRNQDVMLFLLPWRGEFDRRREHRVFCPPRSTDQKPRISAVSQYQWYRQWHVFIEEGAAGEVTAKQVLRGADELHRKIIAHVAFGDGLVKHGFTFDILHTVEGEVQFIELNPFGAMNGCGSCLFHRVNDAQVIYGLKVEAEFRVCR
jgi:hypothetical protein